MKTRLPCERCGFYHLTWDSEQLCERLHYDELNDEIRRKRADRQRLAQLEAAAGKKAGA